MLQKMTTKTGRKTDVAEIISSYTTTVCTILIAVSQILKKNTKSDLFLRYPLVLKKREAKLRVKYKLEIFWSFALLGSIRAFSFATLSHFSEF